MNDDLANAMSAARPSSPATFRSTNGPGVFASERLTGALLDRLTHHVHILEMNGESYRLKQSKRRQRIAQVDNSPASPPNE